MDQQNFFIHESSYLDLPASVGEGTKIWHFSHVQKNSQIGRDCVLGQNVNVGENVQIGNNVKIQNNVSIYDGVKLEDGVFCGPSVVFTNIKSPRSDYPQKGKYISTLIKQGATLGANSTILCGVTVGRFAFVGAGSVVTSDIPDFALVVGNPARRKGWVSRAGHPLDFGVAQSLQCPISSQYYSLENNLVRESNSP